MPSRPRKQKCLLGKSTLVGSASISTPLPELSRLRMGHSWGGHRATCAPNWHKTEGFLSHASRAGCARNSRKKPDDLMQKRLLQRPVFKICDLGGKNIAPPSPPKRKHLARHPPCPPPYLLPQIHPPPSILNLTRPSPCLGRLLKFCKKVPKRPRSDSDTNDCHPETNYHSLFWTPGVNCRNMGFPAEKCLFLQKHAFSYRKMHFPAEKCGFPGVTWQEAAGNCRRASGLKNQECWPTFTRDWGSVDPLRSVPLSMPRKGKSARQAWPPQQPLDMPL